MLEFDHEGHRYTFNGTVVPSVTSLVSPLGDDVDEYIEEAMERAADRGVTCHTVIEMLLRGEDYDGEYPAAYTPYVNAIEQFFTDNHVVPLAVELPIYSKRTSIAGTPDLLCLFNDKLALLDYKFVSSVAKTKVKAQLNGYNDIEHDNGVFPEELYAVQFMPDKYRLYPVAIDATEWQLCLELHNAKNKKHPRGRID